jgi:hypothetical protein
MPFCLQISGIDQVIHNDTGGAAFVKHRLADRIFLVNGAEAISKFLAVAAAHFKKDEQSPVRQRL